jgi:DNA-binding transcriptional LysR family regulator
VISATVSLELRQLECFVAVAEERSFHRAARRLHMTQPPLTRRIKRLERELGTQLLLRNPHGVDLTPTGRVLLDHARRVIGLTDRIVQDTLAAEAGEVGELVVGYFGSVIFDVVPRLLAAFHETHPKVEIRFEHVPKREQVEAIRDGWMHVGFARMYAPEPDLCIDHVAEEPWFVALPPRHPLQELDVVTVADLDAQALVLFPRASRPSFADEVLQASVAAGFNATVRLEAEDAVSALAHVAVGAGLAVVPASATSLALPGVAFRRLDDAPLERVSCVHRLDAGSPVVRSLHQTIDAWASVDADAASATEESVLDDPCRRP